MAYVTLAAIAAVGIPVNVLIMCFVMEILP